LKAGLEVANRDVCIYLVLAILSCTYALLDSPVDDNGISGTNTSLNAFCIDEKTLRKVIANITLVATKGVNLLTIMFPSEPIPATKGLLNRQGLSYAVLVCIGLV
jgi:hypothetical protein